MEYNFLLSPDTPPKTLGVPNQPDITLADFTPKKFLKDVGKAYQRLGGLEWLVTQANAAPQEFMKILQKLLPRQVDLGLMDGVTVKLIDQFGAAIEVSTPTKKKELPEPIDVTPPSKETATSGSPAPTVRIVETFDA